MVPSSSTTAALVPSVPRSQPTNSGMFLLPPISGVLDDFRAVVTLGDQDGESPPLDHLVVVARISDVGGEEDQGFLPDVHAAVRPPSWDVVHGSLPHRLDRMTTILGCHDQPAFAGETDVDLGPVSLSVKVTLGHVVLAPDLAGFEHGGRTENLGVGLGHRDAEDPIDEVIRTKCLVLKVTIEIGEPSLGDVSFGL